MDNQFDKDQLDMDNQFDMDHLDMSPLANADNFMAQCQPSIEVEMESAGTRRPIADDC